MTVDDVLSRRTRLSLIARDGGRGLAGAIAETLRTGMIAGAPER